MHWCKQNYCPPNNIFLNVDVQSLSDGAVFYTGSRWICHKNGCQLILVLLKSTDEIFWQYLLFVQVIFISSCQPSSQWRREKINHWNHQTISLYTSTHYIETKLQSDGASLYTADGRAAGLKTMTA